MSGPLLDRFDFLSLTHEWAKPGPRISSFEVFKNVLAAHEFSKLAARERYEGPDWTANLDINHRRRRSVALVARGLADLDRSLRVQPRHAREAFDLVVLPMEKLRQVFG